MPSWRTACYVAALVVCVSAVDRSKFRTCSQAAFCSRHRDTATEPGFSLVEDSIAEVGGKLTARLVSDAPGATPFAFSLAVTPAGATRLRIVEDTEAPPRWESPDVLLPAASATAAFRRLPAGDALLAKLPLATRSKTFTALTYDVKDSSEPVLIVVYHAPFQLDVFTAGVYTAPAVSVNERSLSYFEHRRSRADAHAAADEHAGGLDVAGAQKQRTILDWGEDGKPIYADEASGEGVVVTTDAAQPSVAAEVAAREPLAAGAAGNMAGMWEESFGSHHDSKPFGPTSVGVDITFPTASHAYGIPEHASSLALKATDGSEGSGEYKQPYRLYNLDVFEYELDNPMALYGAIPFMLAHTPAGNTVGVFWNNPTETYVDIKKNQHINGKAVGIASRWISESGIFELFIMPGPAAKSVVSQYTALTGTTQLPPRFALGYHQCRWNYKDEADVYGVDAKFEEHAFPYDVLWLDIEHTDGKRYFTWDNHLFPKPDEMQNRLAARGHKMVTIVDPHIKRDSGYRVHSEASAKGLYVRNSAGQEYDGWCWPGSSSYLDFTNPMTRDWWASQFALDKYAGSTQNLYIWNDMNEPSVFNGPEVSMNKDAKSIDGVEHREWHNLYGFYQHWATGEGLRRRSPGGNTRPFVLSRSFFAGSQRFGAIWTGDNDASWSHLAVSAPMLLAISTAGLGFAGADVGGFFNNPSTELLIRWYQAGAFQPFFRGHAHIDTARREPWLFGPDVLSALRDAVRTRYTYLPMWYTLFHEAHTTGVAPMRPLWMEFPTDTKTFDMDDQWLVGSDLLVKPVTEAGKTSISVYLPGSAPWYNTLTYAAYAGGSTQTVQAALETLPVFQRGGSIVSRQMRPRRSSAMMADDPYTLVVALDAQFKAAGKLYLDDGTSFDYATDNAFRLRRFTYAPASDSVHVLQSQAEAGGKAFAPANLVERIIVLGLPSAPKSASAAPANGAAVDVTVIYDAATNSAVLRKPDVKIAYDWSIKLQF